MDDPIFDPWGLDIERTPPGAPTPLRWRSQSSGKPTAPVRPPAPGPPDRAAIPTPRARLVGTPGFLRTMAVPRLKEMAQRLVLARHDAVVEDLLDASRPRVQLTVRPWRAPLTPHEASDGRLELGIEDEGEERISLRFWLGAHSEVPTGQESIPTAKLDGAWLEGRVLGFLGQLLDRA